MFYEVFDMIFIGGIAQGRKQFDFIQTMICSKCGRYSSVSVFMTYTYFSFFFIPLFKWNRQYFAVSNCCSTVFSIPNALGEAIARGESVTLEPSDLTIVGMDGTQQHCPECGYLLSEDFLYCPKCGRKKDHS